MALVMCAVVIAGQNYQAYLGHVDLMGLLTSYIGLPLFLALWAGHRIVTGAPRVDPATADLSRSCVLGLSSRGVSVPHHHRFPLDSGSGPISSPNPGIEGNGGDFANQRAQAASSGSANRPVMLALASSLARMVKRTWALVASSGTGSFSSGSACTVKT